MNGDKSKLWLEWERFQTRICLYTDTRFAFWRDNVAKFLSDEFRQYVLKTCEGAE